MELLLYVIFIMLCLIYAKLTISYHPKWLNFFAKKREDNYYSRTDLTVHMWVPKEQKAEDTNEKMSYEINNFEKCFDVRNTLCWSPITGLDEWFEKDGIDRNTIKKIFYEKQKDTKYGYRYSHFGSGYVSFMNSSKVITNNYANKQTFTYIGNGYIDNDSVLLLIYMDNTSYESVLKKLQDKESTSIEIACDIETDKDKIRLFVKQIEIKTVNDFADTYQYKWWNDKEMIGEEKKKLADQFKRFARQIEKHIS